MNNSLQVENKETEEDKNEYIQGIRGWLLVFIVFLGFYSWGWLSPSVKDFGMWIARFNYWKLGYSLLSSFFHLFSIITPLYLIYLLIRKKRNAILFSKIFFFVMPLINTANEYFFSLFPIFGFEFPSLYEVMFSLGFSFIWLLYLNNSIRVANTYLFTENKFPKVIDCPFCFERIGLEDDERNKKIAICPSCGATISKQTVAT